MGGCVLFSFLVFFYLFFTFCLCFCAYMEISFDENSFYIFSVLFLFLLIWLKTTNIGLAKSHFPFKDFYRILPRIPQSAIHFSRKVSWSMIEWRYLGRLSLCVSHSARTIILPFFEKMTFVPFSDHRHIHIHIQGVLENFPRCFPSIKALKA